MKKGFTLIELLVVIAIIAILAAILFPVFARAREKARQASCQSNEKQILLAFQMYVQDYDGSLPAQWIRPTSGLECWPDLVLPYIKNSQVFICPSNKTAPRGTTTLTTYGGNCPHTQLGGSADTTFAIDKFKTPAQTMLIGDSWSIIGGGQSCPSVYCPACYPGGCPVAGDWAVGAVHNDSLNVGFVDGHVKSMQQSVVIQVPTATNDMWGHFG